MGFYTNWAGSITDGVLIPSGDEKQVSLDKIRQGIISATSSRWVNVTSSSPTPTAIQGYASSIAIGVTNAATPAAGDQVTLYHAADPQLGVDDKVRLIRFEIINPSIVSHWMVTKVLDVTTRNDGTWGTNPNSGDGDLFSLTNQTSGSPAATLIRDHRLFVFGDDEEDWLIVVLFDAVNGVTEGVIGFYVPNSDVTGISRAVMGHIWAFNSPPGSGTTQNGPEAWCAPGSVTPGQAQKISSFAGDHVDYPANEDNQYILARQNLIQTTTHWAFVSPMPRVRCIPVSGTTNDFQPFTEDSTDFLVLCRQDAVALVLDVTPDP